MNPQESKIIFYAKRSFPEKINATFEFIQENWKVLLKYSAYLILPICLIQAITVNAITDLIYYPQTVQNAGNWLAYGPVFFVNYGLTVLLGLAGSLLSISIVYTLMAKYNEREERLAGIAFAGLKPGLLKRLKRGLFVMLFTVVILSLAGGVIVLLGVVSRYTLLVSIPLFVASTIPLLLFTPVYLFEEIGIMRAFAKTFRLGFATWMGVLIIFIIMGVISSIVSAVVSIPWIATSVVKYIFLLSDMQDETAISTGYSLMHYAFGVIMAFGSYLSGIFVTVGLAYQYAHAREKAGNGSLVDNIDNLEQL
ncbi:hypothetical protein EZS27_007918 [termite gut metagenome]|uniref:Transmembrane protein n=1 Tax=termite gut metagenome TaxID=433724 RepID=A0A5J4SFD2_9ZZZZ